MTEKRYVIEEIGNMFRVLKDNEPLTTKFENCDKQDVTNLIVELNELHEDLKHELKVSKALRDVVTELERKNKELKASLYAEKTNTAEVVNDYAKQFKRHSAQFSFMIDLAEDLGVDVRKLEASDD